MGLIAWPPTGMEIYDHGVDSLTSFDSFRMPGGTVYLFETSQLPVSASDPNQLRGRTVLIDGVQRQVVDVDGSLDAGSASAVFGLLAR